ncbi:hypothetical protein KQI68_06615 [Peptoniphilus sp. MSJ-1]|uniref:Uncharacterized protein n=1 Tax=Peptoniphilus ovalis TaxID=2841503 RepID=A0ABS6FJX7_9FIRM|nr:hypothetical protein [Peptoniphilus ovalis]MBU5669510.1 hypothetical protein [Peptoniphilus ovalis]
MWKASKLYGKPIFDPVVTSLNSYDLSLIEWLTRFDDPENIDRYKRTIVDDDFAEYERGLDEWEEVKANE